MRLGIARTFQGTRLFPQLRVRENVAAAAQLRQRVGLADALLGTGRLPRVEAAVAAAVDEMLDLLGLVDSGGRRAGDLALRRPAPAGAGAGAGHAARGC